MKSTDCAVEINRKPNTDYTIAVKSDDDKNLVEKSNTSAPATAPANLFGDNATNKRHKSPTTICQNNGDITNANENTVDNSRSSTDINIVNKKGENQQSETNAGAKRQQKTICYDFKKGMCRRRFCRVSYCI